MVFGNLNPLTSRTALPQILQVTSSDTSADEHSYHPLLILYLYGTFVWFLSATMIFHWLWTVKAICKSNFSSRGTSCIGKLFQSSVEALIIYLAPTLFADLRSPSHLNQILTIHKSISSAVIPPSLNNRMLKFTFLVRTRTSILGEYELKHCS
jgi:hypothetical protein